MPSEIRKRFNLDESSMLPIPKNPVEALKGAIKGQVSFKEFMDDRRSDRDMEKTKDLTK